MSERWKVELLDGNTVDIRALGYAAEGIGGRIDNEKKADGTDDWLLWHPGFDALEDPADVQKLGTQLIAVMNAVVVASDDEAKPVRVGAIVDRRVPGAEQRHQLMAGTLEVGSRLYGELTVGGRPTYREMVMKRARLYQADKEVAAALDFLRLPDPTFRSIWNAYEIVRDDLGGPRKGLTAAATLAGVAEADLKLFDANANHPVLGGARARHAGKGKAKGNPSKHPVMSVEEARALVRRIVMAWIQAKILSRRKRTVAPHR